MQAFKCRLKLQISPLKLEGSKSSPSFLLTATMNSLIYSFSSSGGISSIILLSFLELRNSISKLTSLRVFERVFLFCWSSINLSIGLSRDTNLLDCSAILTNISYLLISLNYEQLEYTENIILSKLPDKATRGDRENTIRLNSGL